MDITQDIADAKYNITGYSNDSILINDEPHHQSLIVSPNSLITPWEVNEISQLNEKNLAPVVKHGPEVIIIGTGETLVLPDPKIIAYFANLEIGFETMNTPAACRTYGVLVTEARKVMAGIIFAET